MTKFAIENCNETSIQKDICIIAPFLFQLKSGTNDTEKRSILHLNKNMIENIEKKIKHGLQSEGSIDLKDLENNFLMVSLSNWSLIMMNHDTSADLEKLCSFLSDLTNLKLQIISNRSSHIIEVHKSLKHLLRTINLCMIQSLKLKDKTKVLKPIESIFDLIKNQLSSPYHEVIHFLKFYKFVSSNLFLAHYYILRTVSSV